MEPVKKEVETFEWTDVDVRTSAHPKCNRCHGTGWFELGTTVCNCVFRSIFEACYRQYISTNPYTSRVVSCGITVGRPSEEYAADFVMVGRRALADRPLLLEVFNLYIVSGLDTVTCLRKLNLNQGLFFRRVFSIKQVLGRAFRELRPYPLYPVNEYFARGVVMNEKVRRALAELELEQQREEEEAQQLPSNVIPFPAPAPVEAPIDTPVSEREAA
jgi:hypothetical protein